MHFRAYAELSTALGPYQGSTRCCPRLFDLTFASSNPFPRFEQNGETLHVGQNAFEIYQSAHPNFTVRNFFKNAGFSCEETTKLCSFGGRQFVCCQLLDARKR
ncbi:unnamed protein product [Cylicocyclus nassatus]|uniref:Uncharacterized protein n=1 Tax=Cylicocyclus nassatus TaxID=53992 RepID=A0AA36HFH3_CYLNA|nr:unnamed protein product [Cylicocyclus nassatus]